MGALVVDVTDLPHSPLDAAARFYAQVIPGLRESLADAPGLVLHFPPADHSHRGWRLAAVQELAREAAPKRVNAIAGGGKTEQGEVISFLERSPGVTGQLLAVDGKSAEIA